MTNKTHTLHQKKINKFILKLKTCILHETINENLDWEEILASRYLLINDYSCRYTELLQVSRRKDKPNGKMKKRYKQSMHKDGSLHCQ